MAAGPALELGCSDVSDMRADHPASCPASHLAYCLYSTLLGAVSLAHLALVGLAIFASHSFLVHGRVVHGDITSGVAGSSNGICKAGCSSKTEGCYYEVNTTTCYYQAGLLALSPSPVIVAGNSRKAGRARARRAATASRAAAFSRRSLPPIATIGAG